MSDTHVPRDWQAMSQSERLAATEEPALWEQFARMMQEVSQTHDIAFAFTKNERGLWSAQFRLRERDNLSNLITTFGGVAETRKEALYKAYNVENLQRNVNEPLAGT